MAYHQWQQRSGGIISISVISSAIIAAAAVWRRSGVASSHRAVYRRREITRGALLAARIMILQQRKTRAKTRSGVTSRCASSSACRAVNNKCIGERHGVDDASRANLAENSTLRMRACNGAKAAAA